MSTLRQGDVAYMGIACDHNSSFMRGPAKAPARVRQILHNGASGLTNELGEPVVDHPRFVDLGDHAIDETEAAYLAIEQLIEPVVTAGAHPLIVGGDHAISYPILRAVGRQHPNLTIVHFDAHADLYDEFDGNRHSHACPFARIMEEGLATRLIQIGVRSVNAHLLEQARRFGVQTIAAGDVSKHSLPDDLSGPVYVSFDLDVLDPAFAPGVSHHEPGGLSVRQVLDVVHNLRVPCVGADLVEFNPQRDIHDMTAMVMAKMVREIGSLLLP